MIDEKYIKYFNSLHKDRSESAQIFLKPSMEGVWKSVIDKYSDQAHFIYELIQNADDAGASSVRFILEPERLIFIHNGTTHFSISNPATEDEDTIKGTLGDINAITSIANSNKLEHENKIGKFGVGFKSVFQYTSTPCIYDTYFKFKIENYIVPTMINGDFPGRKNDETLMIFPFNHKVKTVDECYKDIYEKLKSLSCPILFLSSVNEIYFDIGDKSGSYSKSITENINSDSGTIAEKIILKQKFDEDKNGSEQYLWLFTRTYNGLKYSVGFSIDKDNHLIPSIYPAFCYFPTKEITGLKFLVHAPFLLTDSREGIKSGEIHNQKMIRLLAKLAASAILALRDIGIKSQNRIIDDGIFSVIPVNKDNFSDIDDMSRISFLPFYEEIKNIFENEKIIPTRDGYTRSHNSYWASVSFLTELFSDSQLADICSNPYAHWVFVTLGRDDVQRYNKELFKYLDSITKTALSEQHLIRGRFTDFSKKSKDIEGITSKFIEKQPIDWLFKLYKWLSETSSRVELAKYAPIFLDQNSRAVSAYEDGGDRPKLFLPGDDSFNCTMIRRDIMQSKYTIDLIKKLGISNPSLYDEIFNVIIPMLKSNEKINTDKYFTIFFDYYRQCSHKELDNFINKIKNFKFVICKTASDTNKIFERASTIYMPSEKLKIYFETKPNAKFVDLDYYLKIFGKDNEKLLKAFLLELGVKDSLIIESRYLSEYESLNRTNLPEVNRSCKPEFKENYIDGIKENIEYITNNKSVEKSILLWNNLLEILNDIGYSEFCKLSEGKCSFFYYTKKELDFESNDVQLLKNKNWLVDNEGKFVSSKNTCISNLSEKYSLKMENAELLLKIIGIKDKIVVKEDDSNLTEKQRKKMKIAEFIINQGLTIEELEEFAALKRAREAKKDNSKPDNQKKLQETKNKKSIEADKLDSNNSNDEKLIETSEKPINKATSKVANDILRRTKFTQMDYEEPIVKEFDEIDSDELTPPPVDFRKKAELEKEKAANAIDRIAYQEELQQRVLDSTRYTYGWFKSLLELEMLNTNTNYLNSKEISIKFSLVELEKGTRRILILKHPNKHIPQFMEDLTDIPLELNFGDKTKTLAIEVANVKSYTLRVKLKSHVEIEDIDFSKVKEAKIDAKSPAFLLEELEKEFKKLGFSDDFNMQENLCRNIEFVFGPPGTGKTTHLAKNVIIPMMSKDEPLKILVLTPTNKSADVLVRKIMELMNSNKSYEDWLVRFGGTGDDYIENSPVFKDKTFDIREISKNVTVSTIARFPYDFFMPHGNRIFLNGIHWDYIIIDEASMIPLINIVYPLYKKTPRKFIIAGDPFQIEPITSVNLWKDENIYTMVNLDSFSNPQTIPYKYDVKLLTTQYRSIPSIGTVFSKFAYGGILNHHRKENEQRKLNLGEEFNIKSLNIIKFPVSKYESIYRSKRLQQSSSYHIYSALFTFEYANFIAKKIASANPNEDFRIGIIAPYRAQADLIEKLIESEKAPSNIDIQVGTIHGFQGDECDIIFAVFNTPPNITSGPNMFLNKMNIINVSISRAKDYLFIVMPDDETENINNLKLVKKVERILKSDKFSEIHTRFLEYQMFAKPNYLEENSFSTGHQSVNVYGLPEKRYEIRSEDSAVDIQIHRDIKSSINSNENETIKKEVTKNDKNLNQEQRCFEELVYSSKYGEGVIVRRYKKDKIVYIDVKFEKKEVTYIESIAFENKFLIKK